MRIGCTQYGRRTHPSTLLVYEIPENRVHESPRKIHDFSYFYMVWSCDNFEDRKKWENVCFENCENSCTLFVTLLRRLGGPKKCSKKCYFGGKSCFLHISIIDYEGKTMKS